MMIADRWKFAIIGVPVWILVDGTWSSLSSLSESLPEEYKISAYLVFAMALGNIVPLVHGYLLKDVTQKQLKTIMFFYISLAAIAGVLLSFFWNYSVVMDGGRDISLPLMILFGILSACASVSNVTHYTFVSLHEPTSTSTLAFGIALGSMFAGLLSLLRGFLVTFSIGLYYRILCVWSIPAMYMLYHISETNHHSSGGGNGNGNGNGNGKDSMLYEDLDMTDEGDLDLDLKGDFDLDSVNVGSISSSSSSDDRAFVIETADDRAFITQQYEFLLIQLSNAFFSYGLVPSLISYTCGKYRHSSTILLFATSFYCIIDPISKLATNIDSLRIKSITGFRIMTLTIIILSSILIALASLPSNSSMFKGTFFYDSLPVIIYVTIGAVFGFCNTSVFRFFKDNMHHKQVKNSYRWISIATQTGAFLGSLAAFSCVVLFF